MNSSAENPIAYFKYYLKFNSLEAISNVIITEEHWKLFQAYILNDTVNFIETRGEPASIRHVEISSTFKEFVDLNFEGASNYSLELIDQFCSKLEVYPEMYFSKILGDIEESIRKNFLLISTNQFLLEKLERILIHINSKYARIQKKKELKINPSLKLKLEKGLSANLFILKSQYRLQHLIKVFGFLTDNNLIEEEKYNQQEFVEILTLKDSSQTLTFNCQNTSMIYILKGLMRLFNNMDVRAIVDSKRFYTKQGTLLVRSNYDTSKGRADKSQKIIDRSIESFFKTL